MARFSRLLLAGWFLVVATGMPLPARVGAAKTAAERFPCETCPCGCATAEHCWRDCCCFTPAQRLDWARREGVRPPDFALADAKRAELDVSPWLAGRPAPVVCKAEPTRPACCCCAAPKRAPQESPGVVAVRAMECSGLSIVWLAQGSTPPPAEVRVERPSRWQAYSPAPVVLSGLCAAPPTPPPPRCAAAVISLG